MPYTYKLFIVMFSNLGPAGSPYTRIGQSYPKVHRLSLVTSLINSRISIAQLF